MYIKHDNVFSSSGLWYTTADEYKKIHLSYMVTLRGATNIHCKISSKDKGNQTIVVEFKRRLKTKEKNFKIIKLSKAF